MDEQIIINPAVKTPERDKVADMMMVASGILAVILVIFGLVYFLKPEWLGLKGATSISVSPTETTNSVTSPATNNVPVVINTPVPTAVLLPGEFACDPIGICNHYIVTDSMGCPKVYGESTCSNQCADKAVRCKK